MTAESVFAQYYSCQLKVPRFGVTGQGALQDAKCLIVGLGGLGCPLAQYLAASGVGELGLVDADIVELSSINRQILYVPEDIGKQKIEVAKARLNAQYPFTNIETYATRINEENWQEVLSKYDIIVDCTDNFTSKFLIHDACLLLEKDLVQAGVYQTSGQVYYFNFKNRQSINSNIANDNLHKKKGCLRCVWKDAPEMGYQSSCSNSGVLSTVVGTVALMQANTVLLALLHKAETLASTMQIFDWERLEWSRLNIPLNLDCSCSSMENFAKTSKYLYAEQAIEIYEFPNAKEDYIILDVRNERDQHACDAFGDKVVQRLRTSEYSNFDDFIQKIPNSKKYVLVCYRGNRSLDLARRLRLGGRTKAQSLVGGYTALQSKQHSLQHNSATTDLSAT